MASCKFCGKKNSMMYCMCVCGGCMDKLPTHPDEVPGTWISWIRQAPVEELAAWLVDLVDNSGNFCRYLPECLDDCDADREIPPERCAGCMVYYLSQLQQGGKTNEYC